MNSEKLNQELEDAELDDELLEQATGGGDGPMNMFPDEDPPIHDVWHPPIPDVGHPPIPDDGREVYDPWPPSTLPESIYIPKPRIPT